MLGLAASGCAPPSAPPTAADDQPPLLDQMKFESAQQQAQDQISQTYGKKLRIRYHPSLRTVAFIEAPAVALPSASSQGAALVQFVMKYRSLYGVLSEQDLDYVSSEVDGLGMRHLRYRQQKNGVPVWGTELVGHLDGRGALRRLHARLMPLHLWPSASSRPLLLAEAARQQALTKLRAELPSASLSADAPSLFYLPSDKRLALAYRIDLEGQAGDEPLHLALFLDAQSGAELLREDLVARVDVTVPASGHGKGVLGEERELSLSQRGESFLMEDPTRGKLRTTTIKPGERLPGRTLTSKQADRWDEAGQAIDVHAHLMTLWDYFAGVHHHFGWDGKGHGLVAVTHLGESAPLALFDGQRLLFGDGDGQRLQPPGAALDVVAHEYAHALIRSTANLAGRDESGALDEGLADIWACLIEQAAQPMRGNWTLGEQIYSSGEPPPPMGMPDTRLQGLRDLTAPEKAGQARSLAEYKPEPRLDASVGELRSLLAPGQRYHNAGLVGLAGYKLAQRVGNTTTAAILYRAQTRYLHRYSGFADAVDALAGAALDLYGAGATDESAAKVEQAQAVLSAFREVGVSGLGL
jgi:Zn-dependent metalloprotease